MPSRKRLEEYGRFLVHTFMTNNQSLLMGCQLSDIDRSIRKQQIEREHPDWTERQVIHELIRQAFRPNPVPEGLEKFMREREEQERAASNA